jgi:hypothetical protein
VLIDDSVLTGSYKMVGRSFPSLRRCFSNAPTDLRYVAKGGDKRTNPSEIDKRLVARRIETNCLDGCR